MDHYIVSARKYRPSTFNTVVGQQALTSALKHAIAVDKLAHAYLFTGTRGVGKTSCARIFAKTINCEHRTADGEACNQCQSCRTFNEGTSFNIIELDAASHNGIDDMKGLIEQVRVPPTTGKYRVFIIDEVHMLTTAAFNAFLKTLEEPPEYVIFILATTEKHKIIPTILSRCQIYDFSRITIQDMVDHLSAVAANEGITTERSALSVIAKKADGAMRDALSIFDQVAAATLGNITYQATIDNLNILDSAYYSRLVEAFLTGNVQAALLIYKEIRDKGFDSQFFINGLGQYMRDLMVARQPQTLSLLEAADDTKMQMADVGAKCSPQFLYKAMDLCNEADLNFRVATNKQFLIELTLIKLCQLCSPSPGIDGGGEGQLKPIAVTKAAEPAVGYQVQQPAKAESQPQQATQPQTQPTVAPQPAAQPQPAAEPKARADVAAPRRGAHTAGSPSSRAGSLSIKGMGMKNAETADTDAEESQLHRSNPYTDEAVVKAWDSFAQQHPTERILVNTMLACKPIKVGDDRYFVSVDDTIQIETLNQFKADLLKSLRNALGNDNIDFEARISQTDSSPVTWTQREVLQHVAEEHPVLRELIDEFAFNLL